MAVIQANNILEDHSQVESERLSDSGPFGTFVGVYDGHAGPEVSQFLNTHLYKNIKSTFKSLVVEFIDIINFSRLRFDRFLLNPFYEVMRHRIMSSAHGQILTCFF